MKKSPLDLVFGIKGAERKIGATTAAILVLIVLITGAAFYFKLFHQLNAQLESHMTGMVNDKENFINSVIETEAGTMSTRSQWPGLRELMLAVNAGTAGKNDLREIDAILENIMLSRDVSAIELSDARGRVVSAVGEFIREPAMTAVLRHPENTTLLWKDSYYLRVATPMWENGTLIGTLNTEIPLPRMTRALQATHSMGESSEFMICAPLPQGRMRCFPNHHRPSGFEMQSRIDGMALPMSYALEGKSGVATMLNQQREKVFVAYRPVGDSGLGIAAKIDNDELTKPIREELLWTVPFLAALAALGFVLLRWQVGPLVREVVSSRTRVHAIMDNAADGIITIDERGIIELFSVAAARIFGYPDSEAIGKNVSMLMPEAYRGKFDAGRQNHLPTGVAKVIGRGEQELRGQRKDGSVFPMEIALGEMMLNGKRRSILSVRDISALKLAEEKVRKLSMVVEETGNSVMITDRQGVIEYVNPAFSKLSGYLPEEVLGKSPAFLQSGLTPPDYYQQMWETLRAGQEWRGEMLNRKKNDELFWESEVVSPLKDEAGEITHFVAIKEDVTERKRQEEKLRLWERAIESSINPILITDATLPNQPLIYTNPAFERITGYSQEEVLGRSCSFLQNEDHEQPGIDELHQAISEQREGRSVLRNYRKDGSMFWNELLVAPVRDEKGKVTNFICVQNDITERMRYESQLERQANYDTLTALPNRNLFHDRLDQALTYAHRHDSGLAVLLIDLDRFKNINDSLGHTAGDILLQDVATRIAGCVREGDTVARLGGDEFVAILSEIAAEEDTTAVTRKILEALAEPFTIEGRELHVTGSIGIALHPKDGDDAETLLKCADAALYRSKDLGRNMSQFFNVEMNAKAMERLMLEGGLRRALEQREFLLHYQPRVDLRTGEITGMEALVRWQHPEMGLISPVRFIPVAEEAGLIVPLGEWVLRTACEQNKSWQRAGLKPVCVAVNLSARQFRHQDLVQVVAGILKETDLDPCYLELEMTESLIMQNVEETIATLTRLKAMGVKLSIDDFGTGYSSLSYLKRFPIDMLKIDQSFVCNITTDPDDAAIAKTIISMAHDMQLKVIAEGVETGEQKSFLRLRHCDEMQGYFFSRPVPAGEFEVLLLERRCLQMDDAVAVLSQRTLLLLDDEENILTSLTRLLRRDGYKILKATSASAAFELLTEHPVGVIISDQRMPEMSGVEFLRRVKQIYPETVRLVLSGYTDLKSVTDAINEGAVYKFLTKPWDDDLLRANVQEAFQRYDLAQDNRRLNEEMTLVNEELNRAKRELERRVEQKTGEVLQNIGVLQISQEIFEYLPVGVIGVGNDGLIAVANRKADELFDGESKGPLVGCYATDRLPGAMVESLGEDGEHRPYRLENGRDVLFWSRSMGASSGSEGRVLVIVPGKGDDD